MKKKLKPSQRNALSAIDLNGFQKGDIFHFAVSKTSLYICRAFHEIKTKLKSSQRNVISVQNPSTLSDMID